MTKTRNLSDLLDANGDVKSTALDNVPASNDASALTTGTLDNARLPSSIDISGTLTANGISLGDNEKAQFGTGNDLEIYHSGADSYIKDTGTGDLYIGGSSNIWFTKGDGTGASAQFIADGACKLRHNNLTKFETTSTGATVTGTLTATAFSGDGSALTNVGGNNTPSFLATRSSNQTISDSTTTKIQFDSELIDTDSAYDNSTNYRFTVPSGQGGKYLIGARVRLLWDGGSALDRQIQYLYKNGSIYAKNEMWTGSYMKTYVTTITEIMNLSAGDYLETFIYHETVSSASQTIQSSTHNSSFWGFKLI